MAKKLPIDGETFTVEDHEAFLIPPECRTGGAKTPWVWYAPTLPGLPGIEEEWMFKRFSEAGFAVAGMDVGESFGNPEGRALYTALHGELVKNRGLREKACLLARSRGALMQYNWAVEHPDCVACIAGIYPVCDLSSYPGLEKAGPAYGMTEAQLSEALGQHNPIDRLKPLADQGVPIFHIHGDIDELVPLEKNTAELARRYRRFGGEVTVLVPEGQGHSRWTGFFQCPELVDFIIAHAGDPDN